MENLLLIDGAWSPGSSGRWIDVLNPATGEPTGRVAHAEIDDLDRALTAAARGFAVWRECSAYERYKLMRKAADHLRANAVALQARMTAEQGKPLAEAKIEVAAAADIIDWAPKRAAAPMGG